MGLIKKIVGSVCIALVLIGVYVGINLFMTASVDLDQTELCIFRYINEERANRSLPVLANDTNLSTTSISWSNYLASINDLTHGDFETRMQSIGYSHYSCGEIIGSFSSGSVNGLPTENSPSEIARQFVNMWLNSLSHREIMLSSYGGCMGVGVSRFRAVFYGVVDFRFD